MVSPVIIPKRKRNKKNSPTSLKKKPVLLIIIIGIIPAIFYFLFFMNSNDTPQHLEGIWVRTDGGYKIEIKEVQDDGKLDAAYFNPNPINVGRAGWTSHNGKIQVYVELRDKNYPGSNYKLTYVEEKETLMGTYFQAVTKETFEVYFTKKK